MARAAVLAIGEDHPGVVAALTGVVSQHRLNIEVSQMATLSDQFSMMLIVSGTMSASKLEDQLSQADPKGAKHIHVRVNPLPNRVTNRWEPPSHVITIYSPERPGVIEELSMELANHTPVINITHLHSQVVAVPEGAQQIGHYCVTRAFINLGDVQVPELEGRLQHRLGLPDADVGGDVRVEPVRDV
jgi:predicted amino acid-binding ACT domain protein